MGDGSGLCFQSLHSSRTPFTPGSQTLPSSSETTQKGSRTSTWRRFENGEAFERRRSRPRPWGHSASQTGPGDPRLLGEGGPFPATRASPRGPRTNSHPDTSVTTLSKEDTCLRSGCILDDTLCIRLSGISRLIQKRFMTVSSRDGYGNKMSSSRSSLSAGKKC